MHGNEPLRTQSNTQIKMEQPQHSLAPHLDSFTKSTLSLSPPKPHQNVLKTAASSLSLGCACLGMSRALVGQEKVLCGWEGKWWAAGNWAGRVLSSLICCQTPLSDLHPSLCLTMSVAWGWEAKHLRWRRRILPGFAIFKQTQQNW